MLHKRRRQDTAAAAIQTGLRRSRSASNRSCSRRCRWAKARGPAAAGRGDAPCGLPGGARIRRSCAWPWPAPAATRIPRWPMRGQCHRVAALRLAGARRSALFRRRRHTTRRALGACRFWRAPRGAGRRCADRAGIPGAGRGGQAADAAPAGAADRAARAAHRRAQRHRRRAGLGVRAAGLAGRLSPRQDRLAVCRLHRSRCAGRRRRPGAVARLRPVPGRGLPGGRRRARRGRHHPGAGKPAGRDRDLSRPSSASELGLGGAIDYFDRLVERSIEAIPDCDGATLLRAMVRAESERWCRRTACATWRWRPSTGRPARTLDACRRHAPPVSRAWRSPTPGEWLADRLHERWCAWRDRKLTSPNSSAARRAPGTCGRWRGAALARCSISWPASFIRRCCWPACACAPSRSWPKGTDRGRAGLAIRSAAAGHRTAARRRGVAGSGGTPPRRPLRLGQVGRAAGRQRSHRLDGRAPCSALCRPAGPADVVARARRRAGAVALLGPMPRLRRPARCRAPRSTPTPR